MRRKSEVAWEDLREQCREFRLALLSRGNEIAQNDDHQPEFPKIKIGLKSWERLRRESGY